MQTIPKRKGSFSRTLCFLLALLLAVSAFSVGLVTLASAVEVDEDSGEFAESGAAAYGEINVPTIAGGSAQAYWVDATYYDYLSDAEKDNGWLNPIQAGTGFNGAANDWYEFYSFNNRIHEAVNGKSVYPLYFGNFCNAINQGDDYTGTSYDLRYEGNVLDKNYDANHGGPYEHAMSYTHNNSTNTTKLYNYEYFINNSNGLTDYHYAVSGLADNKLSDSGSIRFKNSTVEMPYFNSAWLRDSSRQIGQVINSRFPFYEDKSNANVTVYRFNSENAQDNVYFNWSGKTPTAVGYGQGTSYGVHDGLTDFMGDDVQAGYGIFPFNRASGSNGGNNKLDYGFGIRMNMDFRVPENGTIDGSDSNDANKAIKFDYTGDDDLWVYITPYNENGSLDWSNSQLVLDLGGNHKKASGNINFHTMTASVSAAKAATSTYFRPDTIYIVNNGTKSNSTPFSNLRVWAWTENADGTAKGDGTWVNVGRQDEYYTVKASDMAGRNKFIVSQGEWERQSAEDSRRASGYYGNVTYTDNLEWITEQRSEASPSAMKFGFESDGAGGYKTLDPDKTYHMTIFYMERGMIESNCSMSFTMTPVKNSLKVKKTIHTDGLNAGIKDAVGNMTLNFENTVNNASADTYVLKSDNKTKEFNQYDTGANVTVTEKKSDKGVVWGYTTWKLIDNNQSGHELDSGSYEYDEFSGDDYELNTATDSFRLEDPRVATDTANLQVNFDNYPSVGADGAIHKTVKDDPNNTDEFEFSYLVDINGGTAYQGYDLAFTRTNTKTGATSSGVMDKGKFKMKANEIVTVPDLPAGVTYKLTEVAHAGYQSTDEVAGTIGTAEGSNDIDIENIELTGETNLAVTKYITSNGEDYLYRSGTLFGFKAEGMDIVQGKTTISTSGQSQETRQTNANGQAVFSPKKNSSDPFLKFSHIGKYGYKITETSSGADDISKSSGAIYALVDVTEDLNAATPGLKASVSYYSDAGFTSRLTDISFHNTAQLGSVKVVKYSNNPKDTGSGATTLGGATFNVYKVPSNGADIDYATAVGAAKQTDENGIATFDNLDIYDFVTMERQWYALAEVDGIDGRVKSNNVVYFTLPQEGDNGELKYDITFEYINGAIKNPQTAGWGYGVLPTLGWASIILAAAVAGFWFFCKKKRGRRPAHMRG